MSQKITITADHIAGKLNVEADFESWSYKDSSNWRLSPTALGFMSGGLFCRQYFSRKPDPEALRTDAFMTQDLMYAFPPFCMISRSLVKVQYLSLIHI
jgi:hypothetical protein